MREEKDGLDDRNAQNWPRFQTIVSFLHSGTRARAWRLMRETIDGWQAQRRTGSASTFRFRFAARSALIATLPRACIRPADHARYVDRVIEDLRGAGAWAAEMGVALPRGVDTIYFGGGTPSVLAPELVARLFAAIRAEFAIDSDAEITVECAPDRLAMRRSMRWPPPV